MLPALRLCVRPDEAPTYTRRPNWTRPHESLWGILAKWQFINCLAYPAITACVSSLPDADIYDGLDLRALEGFDVDALAHHSGVPQTALAGGACSISANSPILSLASERLRFCPSCMEEGFHATLFQFTPIARCSLHARPLLDACTGCGRPIPYRFSASFAANPLACPHCSKPLLSNPTVLMRPYLDAAEGDNLLQWQRLLARYAHWYVPAVAGGTKRSIGKDERLAFIGALQAVVQRPPTMTPIASRRTVLEPRRKRLNNADFDPPWKPSFSVEFWPHFRLQDVCRVVPSLCPLC